MGLLELIEETPPRDWGPDLVLLARGVRLGDDIERYFYPNWDRDSNTAEDAYRLESPGRKVMSDLLASRMVARLSIEGTAEGAIIRIKLSFFGTTPGSLPSLAPPEIAQRLDSKRAKAVVGLLACLLEEPDNSICRT